MPGGAAVRARWGVVARALRGLTPWVGGLAHGGCGRGPAAVARTGCRARRAAGFVVRARRGGGRDREDVARDACRRARGGGRRGGAVGDVCRARGGAAVLAVGAAARGARGRALRC